MAARIKTVQKRCTCRRRLGRLQAEFELRIRNGETPIKALENMGITLCCCRLNMLYPPTFPVSAADSGVFYDEPGLSENSRGKLTVHDSPPLYLEGIPNFPTFR
jgi:DNA-directed RNA polymerase subunit N (RpoN/RPB10)